MAIKAKQTVYKSYRFSSRLESRWAYFLDLMLTKWEYEKEPYDLDGLVYIPDFWLPELATWLEIKGHIANDEAGERMIAKCKNLARLSGSPVILAFRDPLDARCAVFGVRGGVYTMARFAACPTCGSLGVHVRTDRGSKFLCRDRHPYINAMPPAESRRFLFDAATAARQARFGIAK